MTGAVDRSGMPAHAAPQRGLVGLPLLTFGLFGAPAAWALQLISNYALMAHFCYPLQTPRASPSFGGVRLVAIVISAALLCVGVAALLVALRSWSAVRHEHAVRRTTEHHETAEVGEGRTRFLAMAGLLVSGIFVYGILMAGAPLIAMPVCAY